MKSVDRALTAPGNRRGSSPRNCRRHFHGPARRSFSKTTSLRCGTCRGSSRSTRCTRTATTWSASRMSKAIASSRRVRRPGRLVNTKAWVFQTNRANVTHVEEGASDPPMRAVLIEVKPPAPRAASEEPADGLRKVARRAGMGEQSCRGLGDHAAAHRVATHRHVGDAVELIFAPIGAAQGDIRAGRDGSRRPDAGRRRARLHFRAQVGRNS